MKNHKSKAWLTFAKLNPNDWKRYDGSCACCSCREYRIEFEKWYAKLLEAKALMAKKGKK